MDTTLKIKGSIGIDSESLPAEQEKNNEKNIETVLQTETRTIEDFPKTSDSSNVFFSVLGMLLVFIVIGINYGYKKRVPMNEGN